MLPADRPDHKVGWPRAVQTGIAILGSVAFGAVALSYGYGFGGGGRSESYPQRTAAAFSAPNTPTVDVVVFAATGDSLYYLGSAFSADPGDVHDSTQIQIDTAGGNWSSPTYHDSVSTALERDTVPPLKNAVAKAQLDSGAVVKARIRYFGREGGWSAWSDSVQFTLRELYTHEPAGMTLVHENQFSAVPTDSSSAGWAEISYGSRTTVVTDASRTCQGLTDDATLRHYHPGDGSAQADYGGSFSFNPSAVGNMDTIYVAYCYHHSGVLSLGNSSEHGTKTEFFTTEGGGGADVFGSWERADSMYAFNFQGNLFGFDDGVTAADSVGLYDLANRDNQPVWFEYLLVANDSGVHNGEVHVWIDGDSAFVNKTVRWEEDGVADACAGSRCGFAGFQLYRNTDQGAGLDEHYVYTSHFYMSYKGIAN